MKRTSSLWSLFLILVLTFLAGCEGSSGPGALLAAYRLRHDLDGEAGHTG